MKKPWERWKIIHSIGGGGHGATSLVEDASHPESGAQFVLKLLNNQRDPERRKRMSREVAALRTLHHPGIPKVIDSNAERFQTDEPLFLVTELIPGPTIEEAIRNQPLNLDTAVKTILRLLDIVEHCHEQDVIHRDIKPENAIFRNGNPEDSGLVDFGLSFNRDAEDEAVTESDQEIGNRFLWLPELRYNAGKGVSS